MNKEKEIILSAVRAMDQILVMPEDPSNKEAFKIAVGSLASSAARITSSDELLEEFWNLMRKVFRAEFQSDTPTNSLAEMVEKCQ